jgi:TonB family protein
MQYKGTRRGDEILGEAKYRNGTSLKWTAFRQQALVTTPSVPKYPAIAAAAHVTGAVRVDVTVDSTGQVTSASVVEGHPLLRKTCEVAAKDWRFNSTGDVAIRKVRLVFSFSLLPPDCKTDVTTLAPEYRLSYMVNVRRRQPCPTY